MWWGMGGWVVVVPVLNSHLIIKSGLIIASAVGPSGRPEETRK